MIEHTGPDSIFYTDFFLTGFPKIGGGGTVLSIDTVSGGGGLS